MFKKIKYLIENNKYKKVLLVLLPLIIVLFFTLIFTSKAFMKPILANPSITSVSVSTCGTMTLSELSSSINLTNAYPMSDNKGLTTTPYTFDVTNTCTTDSTFNVYLVVLTDSTIDESNIKVNLDTTGTSLVSDLTKYSLKDNINTQFQTKTGKTVKNTYLLDTKTITQNGTQSFNLRIWLDKNAGNENMNKTFVTAIAIGDSSTTGSIKFSDKILQNNGGKTMILSKQKPNFATIATINEGVYALNDNYGTSYYFRGAVNNNWVYFAGFYWRIIRINGDESIRLIYSGTTAPIESQAVVMTGDNSQIGTSKFENEICIITENSNNNCAITDVLYAGSTINNTLNTWYGNNLNDYITYLNFNNGYCNEARSSDFSEINFYPYENNVINKNPNLICNITESATSLCSNCINTINSANVGNKYLLDDIGLITADEIALAGGVNNISNTNYYLYNGLDYWTISPATFKQHEVDYNSFQNLSSLAQKIYKVKFLVGTTQTAATIAYNFYVDSNGSLNNNYIKYTYGVRPVINLKQNVITTGTGVWNDPYIVQ